MDDSRQPPAFLTADTPEELRLVMMSNNHRFGRRFHYFDIRERKDGSYIAWFELSLRDELDAKGSTSGD